MRQAIYPAIVAGFFVLQGCAFYEKAAAFRESRPAGAVKADAYGHGVHTDANGRPFRYRTEAGDVVTGPVQRDAYGPGVHKDQFGRPVRAFYE